MTQIQDGNSIVALSAVDAALVALPKRASIELADGGEQIQSGVELPKSCRAHSAQAGEVRAAGGLARLGGDVQEEGGARSCLLVAAVFL